MTGRWVPVDPEDIRPGDTIRLSYWQDHDSYFKSHVVGSIEDGCVRGLSSSRAKGEPVKKTWGLRDSHWERLEPETVSLPVPPEGAQWRLMPDDRHESVMDQAMPYGGAAWDLYREVNGEPEPPLTRGDIVERDGRPGVLYAVMGRYDVPTFGTRKICVVRPLGWNAGDESDFKRVDPDTIDSETLRELRACAFIDDEDAGDE